MRTLSLFSGIGAMDLGLERAGMEIVAQVENDPFCNRVLAQRWPDVERYGDVREFGMGRAQHHVEGESHNAETGQSVSAWTARHVDLVCGGFPCQDVSVAGKRAGLHGERSGLWFEFHRVLSEVRPRWALVENVRGLLSSDQGRDFATILDGLDELGFAVAWAVLDSRHFGVAQRRRRVFVVGSPTRRAAEAVLALCESCGEHPQAGREAGEDVADTLGTSADRVTGRQGQLAIPDVAGTLGGGAGSRGWPDDTDRMTFVPVAFEPGSVARNAGPTSERLTVSTLRADMGDNQPAIRHGVLVRRLTPTECERLQGLPDGWTCLCQPLEAYDPNACRCPDGPRYRVLGNAVTVPVAEYIGRRMVAVDAGLEAR